MHESHPPPIAVQSRQVSWRASLSLVFSCASIVAVLFSAWIVAEPPGYVTRVAFASIALGWLGYIPSIICGHIARAECGRNPFLAGRRTALAGLVLGYCMFGLAAASAIGLLLGRGAAILAALLIGWVFVKAKAPRAANYLGVGAILAVLFAAFVCWALQSRSHAQRAHDTDQLRDLGRKIMKYQDQHRQGP